MKNDFRSVCVLATVSALNLGLLEEKYRGFLYSPAEANFTPDEKGRRRGAIHYEGEAPDLTRSVKKCEK